MPATVVKLCAHAATRIKAKTNFGALVMVDVCARSWFCSVVKRFQVFQLVVVVVSIACDEQRSHVLIQGRYFLARGFYNTRMSNDNVSPVDEKHTTRLVDM